MAKYLALRWHTDDDDDALSADGLRPALGIGAGLQGDYDVLVWCTASARWRSRSDSKRGARAPVPTETRAGVDPNSRSTSATRAPPSPGFSSR